jgi:AcrR family transcriptional regulator
VFMQTRLDTVSRQGVLLRGFETHLASRWIQRVTGRIEEMMSRAEMSEVRRVAVLDATASLLDEVGVAALTVRQVAQRAGVAQGSVFLYAESKADLLNKVYGRRIAQQWHVLLDELSNEQPLDRVEKFYLGCVDIFYGDLENVLAFYRELGGNAANRLDAVGRLLDRVRDVLYAAAHSGGLRSGTDVEVLAYSYQGLYSNVISLASTGTDHATARRIIAESMKQLRSGVAP